MVGGWRGISTRGEEGKALRKLLVVVTAFARIHNAAFMDEEEVLGRALRAGVAAKVPSQAGGRR